jgi:putative restriction endonuclease
MDTFDTGIRLRAFQFLDEQCKRHGDVLPRKVLAEGFESGGHRIHLIGPEGIFKPAVLPKMPISITTVPIVEGKPRPYEDELSDEGVIRYRYRGTNPNHPDNVGLRLAMERGIPLIYFFGIRPSRYMPVWPVYIVGDDPRSLTFTVQVGERRNILASVTGRDRGETSVARAYRTITVQHRLHQQSFRERVIEAYRQSCAICRLHHTELLEAAHILPDGHPKGEPWVSNGLSLCKLHHGAFDSYILGVRPDLVIEIRKDVLDESDGPMLMHGLQECHNARLAVVPIANRLKPNKDFLEERYELFRKAG